MILFIYLSRYIRSERTMKLTPPSYLMLGLIRLGARSGYAIKQTADVSTRFFWPTSLAQVYPQLAQLEHAGLLSRTDDSHGSRRRSAYQLTDAGHEALRTWLRSSRDGTTHFRDEGILRLFAADALPDEDQLALVRRLRERARRTSTRMRMQIVPLAATLESSGNRYPALVARLGADTYAYVERWLTRLESQLEHGAARAPGWMLDELAHAGAENLDSGHVARYDAKEDADAHAEVALLERLGLTRQSVVLELGCGTGQFTLAVAPACARAIAVDVSEPMLARLRAKATQLGVRNVETVRAGFLSYEHDRPPVDFVYSRYALHHLPDFWKALALARLRRALRAGGVLRLWDVVYDFSPADAPERIEAWCASAGHDAEGEWSRSELEEHVRDEHSTFTWLLEPMMLASGFQILDAQHSDDRIFARYVLRAV
jgi:DNA-binding PadR family transcriptional regulator/ubiquinone/menaquinone biosynthesis C-methylase UbiE